MNDLEYRGPMGLQTPEQKQMGLILHLTQLINVIAPPLGWIVPIVLWQVKKDEMPALNAHGRMVTNWIISSFIYTVISGVLSIILVGLLGLLAIYVMGIVFAIIGGIKANSGELWEYPLTIKFLK